MEEEYIGGRCRDCNRVIEVIKGIGICEECYYGTNNRGKL